MLWQWGQGSSQNVASCKSCFPLLLEIILGPICMTLHSFDFDSILAYFFSVTSKIILLPWFSINVTFGIYCLHILSKSNKFICWMILSLQNWGKEKHIVLYTKSATFKEVLKPVTQFLVKVIVFLWSFFVVSGLKNHIIYIITVELDICYRI